MEPGGAALIGIFKNIKAPTVDLLGWSSEGYAGGTGGAFDSGARLYLASPALFLQGGIDYSFRLERSDFILSASVPLRRGGILGRGSTLRVDWIPGRGQAFNMGFTIPLFQPWAGKTRPNSISFRLPAGKDESKKRPVTDPRGFAAWLGAGPAVPAERREAVIAVFDTWLAILEKERLRLYRAAEGDSRGEWLSPDLALRPEDHDIQAEIDAIIEKAVGRPFTRGNAVMMLGAPQVPPEVIRMIRQTEDYHVLWIHDFRGLNAALEPDALGHDVRHTTWPTRARSG
jgi:hypothetical protein